MIDVKKEIGTGMNNFADRCRDMANGTSQVEENEVKKESNWAEDKLKRIEAILRE